MGDFRHSGGGGGRGFGGGNRGGGFGGNRGGFGGNRGSFGGRGGDRGPVTMHSAVCDECKKPCEVPFRPTGEKPVYCSACFGGKRDERGGERRDDRGGDRPERTYNDFKAPARSDFSASPKSGHDDIKKQLEMINIKIDQIFKAVEIIKNGKSSAPTITVTEAKSEKAKEISKKEVPVKIAVVAPKENKEKKSTKKVSKKK